MGMRFRRFAAKIILTSAVAMPQARRAAGFGGEKRGPADRRSGVPGGCLAGKIVAVTDALGHSARFVILPGQACDLVGTPRFMEGLSFGTLTADRAFDAGRLLKDLEERGSEAVIPPRKNRRRVRDYDSDMYGQRHQIKNFFMKIKEFRAIVTRYDKTDASFAAAIYPVAGLIAAK